MSKLVKGIQDQVLNLEHEIDTLFTSYDWLGIYQKTIKDQRLDMEATIQQTRSQDKYRDDLGGSKLDVDENDDEMTPVNQLELLNLKYNSNLDWN